jgi:three-Cys-motif partner protein
LTKLISTTLPLFPLASGTTGFFQAKRPWSIRIKDRILASYLKPYLPKIARLGEQIILIDAFAGPGRFEDGTKGSPLILCEAAEQQVPNQWFGVFVNQNAEHHAKLSELLKPQIDAHKAVCIHGDAGDLLKDLGNRLRTQTVFLYLDPFGLKGCDFDSLTIFLSRKHSTEILINISPRTIHRLAAMKVIRPGGMTPEVIAFNACLTRVLGGEYWKTLLAEQRLSSSQRVANVVAEYRKRLAEHLPYAGSCPVREAEGRAIKYYMIHCSRHPDALLLMNDHMCIAYNEYMHDTWKAGTLFDNTEWDDDRDLGPLDEIIVDEVRKQAFSRKALNVHIARRDFMRWTTTEYRRRVKKLVADERLTFGDVRHTGRLNDDSLLFSSKPPRHEFSTPLRMRQWQATPQSNGPTRRGTR